MLGMLQSISGSQLSRTRKVTNAEVMMSNFHCRAQIYCFRLLIINVPDSAIAIDSSCNHTKTRQLARACSQLHLVERGLSFAIK